MRTGAGASPAVPTPHLVFRNNGNSIKTIPYVLFSFVLFVTPAKLTFFFFITSQTGVTNTRPGYGYALLGID